jgi:hypothetical protein
MANKRTDKTRRLPTKVLELIKSEENKMADTTKPTKPRHFRKKAQEEIGRKYEGIVEKLAEKATQGSVQHTKLLFELGGVKEQVQASSQRKRRALSLGEILLKEAEAMKRDKEKVQAITEPTK